MFSLRPLPAMITGKEAFYLIVTWFHAGRIRPASGTWGSLAAWPFCWIIKYMGGLPLVFLAIIATFAAGYWAVGQYARHSKQPDPSEVVIDEVIGMLILWLAVPADSFALALLGFACFRVFDAFKRGPVGWCDKNIKGTPGVIIDDMVAGLMAAAVVWAALFIF